MNKKIVALSIACLIICISALVYSNKDNSKLLKAHGMVDIRQSDLSFERSGKISKLYFDEGEVVKAGTILASLDTQDLDHQIKIKTHQCQKDEAYYQQLSSGFRVEEIEQAKANVEALSYRYELSKLTYQRYDDLLKSRSTSKQQRDEAFFSMQQLLGQLSEAKANLKKLQKGYRSEDIQMAKAQLDSCLSSIDYLNYQKQEQSIIKAPFDGFIRSKKNEIGDMTGPNQTVYELSMLNNKRLRVYASLPTVEKIKLGNSVYVDDSLGHSFKGTVSYISNTAMFTPKSVQTEDLRADLVYEIRIEVTDEDNLLKLGQPISVIFDE